MITILAALLAVSPPRPPVTIGDGPPLTYLVLGDSTAAGEGGGYDVGIAMSTTRALAQTRRVTMVNLSVSGARINDVRSDQLERMEGIQPDVVLLSVGANDVTHLTRIAPMRRDLRRIVGRLRTGHPSLPIVITGSPDMGSPPRIPRILRGLASCRTKRVNQMFEEEALALGLTFAPIARETGPQFRRDRSLFHADRFHPNDRGYATWVPVLVSALDEALRTPR